MNFKKNIIFICCILSYCCMQAQDLYWQTRLQQSSSAIPLEALKIDLSKTPDMWYPTISNNLPQRANNGWYPVKGEFYRTNETEIAGYINFTIGQNGLLDKQITVSNHPDLYDSTVCIMNRTPYTKGKDLIDTVYNYWKNPDGSYRLDFRRVFSYHYFDHFEADSFYFEYIYYQWDDVNKEWKNYYREKNGYHDTLVQFSNRNSKYVYGPENTWKVGEYHYDSITYNQQGFVDSMYMIRDFGNGDRLPLFKMGFTNDEYGRYTQVKCLERKNNQWITSDVLSNITWTEWNGFMYGQERAIGGERLSPYKRSKIGSYYFDTYDCFYKKQWDIDGTLSNIDGYYWMIDGELYPSDRFENIYNEYDNYVVWRNTTYSRPDESGNQKMNFYAEWYYKRTYDEIYGMTENKLYIINLTGGKIDTTFVDGIKYTEFAPVSITEPKEPKQTLSIFPNPVSGVVTIAASAEIDQLSIFDITGRLVESPSPTGERVVFDTSALPSGVYLVRVLLKDGGVRTGKMVVY